jgi:hypothetical protein
MVAQVSAQSQSAASKSEKNMYRDRGPGLRARIFPYSLISLWVSDMDLGGFGFAILPPVLAIVVERLNPINGPSIRTSAERDFVDFQQPEGHTSLLDYVTQSAKAAVEVSGLAPTLVAAVTSGFAIIHDLANPFWPALGYVTVFVIIALGLLRLLAGWTYFEIGTRSWTYFLFGKERSSRRTRSDVVSATIYATNILIIFVAVIVAASGGGLSVGSIVAWFRQMI